MGRTKWRRQQTQRKQQNFSICLYFLPVRIFVQQMNNSLDLLNWCNTDNVQYRVDSWQFAISPRNNAIEDRLWVRIYIFVYIYFLFIFFSIEFFEGVSRGGPYRWSMDRSVRWSVDPVRWTGPRTGGQCFRVTQAISEGGMCRHF